MTRVAGQIPNPKSLTLVILFAESRSDFGPVDYVPPGREVVRTPVLILQIVGVLPHVDAENRLLAFHDWLILVRRALNGELAVLLDQPRPAAAETRDPGFRHLLLEAVEAAERRLDGVAERAARRAARLGPHPLPE